MNPDQMAQMTAAEFVAFYAQQDAAAQTSRARYCMARTDDPHFSGYFTTMARLEQEQSAQEYAAIRASLGIKE